jgi:hypothetical protein
VRVCVCVCVCACVRVCVCVCVSQDWYHWMWWAMHASLGLVCKARRPEQKASFPPSWSHTWASLKSGPIVLTRCPSWTGRPTLSLFLWPSHVGFVSELCAFFFFLPLFFRTSHWRCWWWWIYVVLDSTEEWFGCINHNFLTKPWLDFARGYTVDGRILCVGKRCQKMKMDFSVFHHSKTLMTQYFIVEIK